MWLTSLPRPLVSSMLAPAVQQVMHDFGTTSPSFATFCVSIFVLGFACGPLVLPPLSEMYGRVVIYNSTNVLFLGFTMLCAVLRNEAMFLVFRFLSGFAGVATITIGSGTIVDLMPREQRGLALSVWSVGTILGPTVGPIIGGYVTEVSGWRSMFWAISVVVSLRPSISQNQPADAARSVSPPLRVSSYCGKHILPYCWSVRHRASGGRQGTQTTSPNLLQKSHRGSSLSEASCVPPSCSSATPSSPSCAPT